MAEIEGCLVLTPSLMALLSRHLKDGLAEISDRARGAGPCRHRDPGRGADVLLSARRAPSLRGPGKARRTSPKSRSTWQRLHWIRARRGIRSPSPCGVPPRFCFWRACRSKCRPAASFSPAGKGSGPWSILVLRGLSPCTSGPGPGALRRLRQLHLRPGTAPGGAAGGRPGPRPSWPRRPAPRGCRRRGRGGPW